MLCGNLVALLYWYNKEKIISEQNCTATKLFMLILVTHYFIILLQAQNLSIIHGVYGKSFQRHYVSENNIKRFCLIPYGLFAYVYI